MTTFLVSLLLRLWGRISVWAAISGAVLAALGIAWLKGRAAGKAAWEAKRQAAKAKAIKKSSEIRHDVQVDNDAGIDRRLDRWMRD